MRTRPATGPDSGGGPMTSERTGTGAAGRAGGRTGGRRLLRVLGAGVAVAALAACANVPAGPGAATLGTAAAPGPGAPQADPGLSERLAAQVSGDAAFAHLQELERIAAEHGGNRAVGTPGYDASVDYVSSTLREAGFEVQTPSFDVRTFTANDARLTVADAPVPTEVLSFSPATPPGGLTAPLSVLPRTPQDPTPGCEAEDYAGIRAGSIAVVERGVCPFGQKSQLAGAAGAGAVIIVNTEDAALPATLGETPGVVPTAAVQKTAGEALRDGQQATLLLATTIQKQTSRNVIAETSTGDPDRVVMAGAHLDSVPEGAGINDNGSGSAALLDVAQKLGAAPPAGQKVRFAWWGAEEIGLVGATRYVESLSEQDRARLALYLNFDMVGSPNAGYLVYDGDDSDGLGGQPGPAGSETAEQVLTDALVAAGVQGPEGTAFDGRSDYGPFIEAGVPAGGLFTGAEEKKTPEQAQKWGGTAGQSYDSCYHTPCDGLSNIDRTALDRNVTAMGSAIGRFAEDLTGIPPR